MKKETITERQKELLSLIYDYIKTTGYPPAFGEMREGLDVSSNQSVIDLLEKLKKKGLIRREEVGVRSIVILPLGCEILNKPPLVSFLGTTSAGAPIESIDVDGEWQSMPSHDEELKKLKEEVFLLKISGDSMINAGIDDGDVVLVKSQKEFISGDIVLAQVGDSSTIKRFVSENKPPYVYLKPENPNYKNILFTDETKLSGKVISVLKNNYWKSIK